MKRWRMENGGREGGGKRIEEVEVVAVAVAVAVLDLMVV